MPDCYQSQNYKIWKQFTTYCCSFYNSFRLLSITKLQNLKAIHNVRYGYALGFLVVINHKTTKFESNSQLYREHLLLSLVVINHKTTKFESNSQRKQALYWICPRCYQSQNYKIWKQFTTHAVFAVARWKLLQSQNYKIWKQFTTTERQGLCCDTMLSITKLQNLKAIHNSSFVLYIFICDVINHKTTKFESNSQHLLLNSKFGRRCYQSQNYKIWKQFTTRTSKKSIWGTMLSIIKLQNLKAIHNKASGAYRLSSDVINHKTTKFESNSQLASVRILSLLRCYQSQNYKIWKQFTTWYSFILIWN